MNPSDLIVTTEARPIPWPQFVAEVEAMYSTAAKTTLSGMRLTLRDVGALGVVSTDQLDVGLVARFVASRDPAYSPWTVKAHLIRLRALCSHAESSRYLIISPFRLRKLSRWVRTGPPEVKRCLTPAEVKAILGVMAEDVAKKQGWAQWRARRLYALTATIAYTGVRATEGQRLQVADVHLASRLIDVRPHGKTLKTTASEDVVAMPPALVPIVTEWLRHRLDAPADFPLPERCDWLFPNTHRTGPWTSGSPSTKPIARLQAAAARAGIEGVTFHAMRRGWATMAEAMGIPLNLVSRQLRHTSETTTRRYYAKKTTDALRDAVDHFPEF